MYSSFVASAYPSPVTVSAPSASRVAFRAASSGASWFCVRPSCRSFSRWVGVALFSCPLAASCFAQFAAARLAFPFCAVRSVGSWWSVSVPCAVLAVPFAWAGCLPLAWFPLAPVAPSPGGVPGAVAAAVSTAPALGFSGSRSVVPSALGSVLALAVGVASPVLVGCAQGCDRSVRESLPAARVQVFAVAPYGRWRGSFAARSVAFVAALAAAGGALFSFPAGSCPVGLLPSRSPFRGSGSGSWASLALGVALGVSCFVFLGAVSPPLGWGFMSLGGGWWWVAPASCQLSLF